MDEPFQEEATQRDQGWGRGYREGTGSQEDSGGSTPKAVLHGPNITPRKYIFQGQKKACLLWEGISGCSLGSQTGAGRGGQWMDPYLKPL